MCRALLFKSSQLLIPILAASACAGGRVAEPKSGLDATSRTPEEAACLEDAGAERTAPTDAPERISASHILVRHQELKRPEGATLSRGQACLRALQALEALQGGAAWGDAVQEFSDSGKSNAGDLGTVAQSDLTPRFASAAFNLAVDELSYVVETDRGFHVILRTE